MPTSKKKLKSNVEYDKRMQVIFSVKMPKLKHADLQKHIESTGETRVSFVKRAIAETIERDNERTATHEE